MKSLFGKHRVRATFYHVTAGVVAMSTVAQLLGFIPIAACFYITTFIFFADYLAEMYDPHPDNPGTWFVRHFHRFLDDDED